MATARAVRGVLESFLGTYTSRYTDYEGYWLFGFLAPQLGELALEIDLMVPMAGVTHSPIDLAGRFAAAKFERQLEKAGLRWSQVREAGLVIRKLPETVQFVVNGHSRSGNRICFSAFTVMSNGRRYRRERVCLVAPHDARSEHRSMRAVEPDRVR